MGYNSVADNMGPSRIFISLAVIVDSQTCEIPREFEVIAG